VPVQELARQAQGAHGVLGVVAAGGVGQVGEPARRQRIEQRRLVAFWPMLVRRMATVTISAPLASTARRVSSKSLYLPVPIRRRERYARPATRSGSRFPRRDASARSSLAPAHRDDDLSASPSARPVLTYWLRGTISPFLSTPRAAGKLERLDQARHVRAGLDTPIWPFTESWIT